MTKHNIRSSIISLGLFNLMTVGCFLLFLLARANGNNAVEMSVKEDGSIDTLTKVPKYTTYPDVATLSKITPVAIKYGSPISKELCTLKIPAPQGLTHFTSTHGFTIFTPAPAPEFAKLIENARIVFAGKATRQVKQTHVEMLKKALLLSGNHQLIARILAHPNFKFVIDYGKRTPGKGGFYTENTNGAYLTNYMLVFFPSSTFVEETFLINVLRNELASMNAIFINYCRLGVYETRVRPSLFELDSNSRRVSYKNDYSDYDPGIEEKVVIREMNKVYKKLIKIQDSVRLMAKGEREKDAWFFEFETHLQNFAPSPSTLIISKIYKKHWLLPENKIDDENFDVYRVKHPQGNPVPNIHILPNSYREKNNGDIGFNYYPGDPRTLSGKIEIFYAHLTGERENTIGAQDAFYASKGKMGAYEEWFSFLEGSFSSELLQFLFPMYCEHATKYAQIEESRSYCAP